MKKGIVLVYDPHNIHQFLWYYSTYGKDKIWSALCLPNDKRGEYLSEYCKKAGIFEKIYTDDLSFSTMCITKRIPFFIKMLIYAILGKQIQMCRQLAGRKINLNDYDEIVVLTDVGVISGAFIGLGREKRVIILEDGYGDYARRTYSNIFSHFFNINYWQGLILSILGYSNPAHYFPLKTTKNCYKFSSMPDKMLYKDYKSLEKLYDFSNTDMCLFERVINSIYPDLNIEKIKYADVILFTDPITDYVKDDSIYIKKIEEYINANYKNVFIKRHPRELSTYTFNKNICVCELQKDIPAEVILPYVKNKKIVFTELSSILMYLDSSCEIVLLYFNDLYYQCIQEKTLMSYGSKNQKICDLERFEKKKVSIIDL